MSETWEEQLSRVRMMATQEGGTWDLSDNDRAALQAVLARLDEHEKKADAADESEPEADSDPDEEADEAEGGDETA